MKKLKRISKDSLKRFAFYYINENLHLAEELDDKVMQAETTVELALLFTVAGMYLEAKEILDS